MDFVDETTGFGISGLDILKTTDAGASWTTIYTYSSPPFWGGLYDICFIDDQTGWVVGGFENSSGQPPVLLYTDDGGQTWDDRRSDIPMVADGEALLNVFFLDQNHGWIAGDVIFSMSSGSFIIRTSDGGTTWARTDLTDFFVADMHFTSSLNGWIVMGSANSKKAYTVDGGINWTISTGGGHSVWFLDSLHGYIVGGAGGSDRIIYTDNGGMSWTPQIDPHPYISSDYLNGVRFTDAGTGWIVGDQGEVLSTLPECLHHGDVDFNSTVSVGDAQLAFQIALHIFEPTYEEACAADCNGDGTVSCGDAQQIYWTAMAMDNCADPV
jgi:photosystem II stability/assembly factor-like uncharacterized protein